MNKKLTFVAVAAVGVVVVATWSIAQAPKDSSSSGTSAPAARTTSSGTQPGIDSSLAPFRGGSTSRSDSLPSASSAATSIRIEHALVTSLDPIKLPARDAGAIREITVKKGMEVKVDDVLGQLDDRDSQIKRRIAELERDAAKIQADSTAQIDAAKKGEEVTRENLKANEEIFRKSPGAISPFDMRRSKFEWERSLAQIAVAEVEKAVAYATQLAKEGQIEGADNEIERRKIVAPIDGFVNEVYRHKGEWCQPGDPVLELVRMDRLEIEGFVYAADASPSKVLGKPVDVVVELAGGESYKASSTISFASPVLEGSGRIRQFRVSTEIDNKKVPGEDGKMHWLIQPGTEAEMIIHYNPPPARPVIAPKTPAGTKSGLPGSKVEAFKPATPDAGAKEDAKSEPKSEAKGATKDGAAKPEKVDKAEPSKSDESKAGGDAKESTKSGDTTKPAEKNGKEPAKSATIKL
ncbi:MAG TPA: HlyD family efflux transporter periplasmic adaptor subunit [Pirellulaceae bacterium]|nr:HlyD family efflux transporter periplasmic adaptor subunit [Pirellulaceae bacterium]